MRTTTSPFSPTVHHWNGQPSATPIHPPDPGATALPSLEPLALTLLDLLRRVPDDTRARTIAVLRDGVTEWGAEVQEAVDTMESDRYANESVIEEKEDEIKELEKDLEKANVRIAAWDSVYEDIPDMGWLTPEVIDSFPDEGARDAAHALLGTIKEIGELYAQ